VPTRPRATPNGVFTNTSSSAGLGIKLLLLVLLLLLLLRNEETEKGGGRTTPEGGCSVESDCHGESDRQQDGEQAAPQRSHLFSFSAPIKMQKRTKATQVPKMKTKITNK
jgi:hypothetical protein